METATVDVVVLDLDREAREIIGEGTRRRLYDILKRTAARTPMGWVILEYTPDLEEIINEINSKVGRPVIAVVKTALPAELLREWLREYETELEQSLLNYMNKHTPTSYVRRKEIANALLKLKKLLGEQVEEVPEEIYVEGW